MEYNIEIKKLDVIDGSKHRIDIYNHRLIVYVTTNDTIVKAKYVYNPLESLSDTITTLKEGFDVGVLFNFEIK